MRHIPPLFECFQLFVCETLRKKCLASTRHSRWGITFDFLPHSAKTFENVFLHRENLESGWERRKKGLRHLICKRLYIAEDVVILPFHVTLTSLSNVMPRQSSDVAWEMIFSARSRYKIRAAREKFALINFPHPSACWLWKLQPALETSIIDE